MSEAGTFVAVAYRRGDDGVFYEHSRASHERSAADAARLVAGRLPMGYGGHNRTARIVESLVRGETERTPLGEYRVEVSA